VLIREVDHRLVTYYGIKYPNTAWYNHSREILPESPATLAGCINCLESTRQSFERPVIAPTSEVFGKADTPSACTTPKALGQLVNRGRTCAAETPDVDISSVLFTTSASSLSIVSLDGNTAAAVGTAILFRR